MTEITTTLRWLGNDLFAGDRRIGVIWQTPKRWNACLPHQWATHHLTESAARSALEIRARSALELAAREALSDG